MIVDREAPLARRAAAADDAILAEQRLACPFARQMLLGVGQAQARVRDDPIELCHQRGLRQDRQLLQLHVAGVRITDDFAVVGRIGDRVLQDAAQAVTLVSEQSLMGPALPIEHLSRHRLEPLPIQPNAGRALRASRLERMGGHGTSHGRLCPSVNAERHGHQPSARPLRDRRSGASGPNVGNADFAMISGRAGPCYICNCKSVARPYTRPSRLSP